MKVAKILFRKPNDFQSIHPDSTGDGNTWTAKSDQNDGAHSLQDLNERKSKDWLARNQNNVSEWGDLSICGLLLQSASTIKIQLSMLV
jgi:hypothetical protein